jgi:bifunctional non-homologous end joining protein LigD
VEGYQRVAFVAFDVLYDGPLDVRPMPLTARRARLERILSNVGMPLMLSDFVPEDGRPLYEEARHHAREGIIAKRAESPYQSGRRSLDWMKLKLVKQQEFLVGGWTDAGGSRLYFGALLLAVRDDSKLKYVGHTGSGFDTKELERVYKLLKGRETKQCPFDRPPKANQHPHWIDPPLVAAVRFAEWTSDGKLRQPIYLGLRDDVAPESVHREVGTRVNVPAPGVGRKTVRKRTPSSKPRNGPTTATVRPEVAKLTVALSAIEEQGGRGVLTLGHGTTLKVTHLNKVLWPTIKATKGDLLRYYVAVSPYLLPIVEDRPLVMKRYPNGLRGSSFYQQRAPESVPAGVRVATLPSDEEVPSRLIGGSLLTLLYMAQLAVISQDPWFSRLQSPDTPDYAVLDLDPMPAVSFRQVIDVARWTHEALQAYDIPCFLKTSGGSGLHIYIPLAPGTTYESSRLFSEIFATMVAHAHPKYATVERTVDQRGKTVYVDYLQNSRGKTLACAYSVRATTSATVSAPLRWEELTDGLTPQEFTMTTMLDRLKQHGDLWKDMRLHKGIRLSDVLEQLKSR